MIIIDIEDEYLSQHAYLVACPASGEAVVVDPQRDIDRILEIARENEVEIVAVTETHIHADFACGARELADQVGATLYVSGETTEDWEYQNLDGLEVVELFHEDKFEIGSVTMEALHTPGHTPEHLSFMVHDGGTPRMILTGDFVFVGDLGRPDLLDAAGEQGTARRMARSLFDSLTSVFTELPENVTLWPGHGAGSSCGKGMSSISVSSVGYERRNAWWADYVSKQDFDGFVEELLDGQPEVPTYYPRMKFGNRDGFEYLGRVDIPDRLMPKTLAELHEDGAQFIDMRDLDEFGEGHVKGALNMQLDSVAEFAGWFIDADEKVVLIGTEDQADCASRQLARIAVDRIAGWATQEDTSEVPQASNDVIGVQEARLAYKAGRATVLDVRADDEWDEGHIEGATHIHYGKLTERLDEVPAQPVIVHCASGTRATMAASYLQSKGIADVHVMIPGYDAW